MQIEVLDNTADKIIREWRPNERQADFLSIPDTVFEALYGGAVGGGKSDVILMLPLVNRYYNHPLFHGIIFRRTFPELEESIILRAQNKWYRPLEEAGICKYNSTYHRYTFTNGARIQFNVMEQDDDARSYDSAQFHYIGVDEASRFSEFQLRFISSRCRTETKDLPAIYRLASNPGGPGHAYLRDRFIKPAREGYTILIDKLSGTKRIFIPAKLQDNPHIYETDPEYVNRLQMLPDAERKAKMDGDWFSYAGQVFSEFRERRIPGETPNALHVIDDIQIPDWWPKILAIDWGYDANTVGLLGAISPDNRLFIYKEYINRRVPISVWASDIARLVQYEKNLKAIELDPSAWHNRGQEKTIDLEFKEYSKLSPRKADNDRISGKALIHEYLRWAPKPKRYTPQEGFNQNAADRILRMQGLEALKKYEASFTPEPDETNIPKLQIFRSCENLIETIKLCQYADKKQNGKPVEDVEEFDGDDAYDCLRYLLKGTRRYYEEARTENDKRTKLGSALDDLLRNNDYTQFNQRVQKIESVNRGPQPVVRRRRNAFH